MTRTGIRGYLGDFPERPSERTAMSDDLDPCGDAGCVMLGGKRPTGQHTNGGCQHLKERGPGLVRMLRAMGREFARLRAEVADARMAVAVYRDASKRVDEQSAELARLRSQLATADALREAAADGRMYVDRQTAEALGAAVAAYDRARRGWGVSRVDEWRAANERDVQSRARHKAWCAVTAARLMYERRATSATAQAYEEARAALLALLPPVEP
jgi:hypothetical protein